MPLLKITDLNLSLKKGPEIFHVLKNINMEIDANECLGVVGESGSGKTLTSLAVIGLLPKNAIHSLTGSIIFDSGNTGEIDLLKLSEKEWRSIRGREIAMIFQEPMTALNPVYTCGRQLMENIKLHRRLTRTEIHQRAHELLHEVKLTEPERILNAYPHQLSGGQRQRVMIAMALAQNPLLLIADEPTTALDVTVQAAIMDLLKELQKNRGLGILFISHDLGQVKNIAGHVAVMYKGEVVEQGPSENIFTRPKHIYTQALLQCRPQENYDKEYLPVLSDFMENTGSDTGKTEPQKTKSISSVPVIKIKALNVVYKLSSDFSLSHKNTVKKALDNISLEIHKGETIAVVGESGSGKTTLGRAILKLINTTGGEIEYLGEKLNVSEKNNRKSFRKKFQLVFQDPYSSLNPRLSIGFQISEAVHNFNTHLSQKQAYGKTLELLTKVGLDENQYNKYPHEFSGGQRQRICIARALAPEPEFIVLDEAVSALDVSVQAQILNLLKKLQLEMGLTYFFITHDLYVARFIADRILVIKNGKIEEMGNTQSVFNHPQSDYTQQLLSAAH